MATKTQYEFFRSLYDEENNRLSELVNRAKVYLPVVTFFLGVLLLKSEWVISVAKGNLIIIFFFISMFSFFAALVTTIVSLRVMKYKGICDPEDVITQWGKSPPEDEQFFKERIADFAVAAQKNHTLNNTRGSWLHTTGIFLLIGVACSLIFLSLAISNPLPSKEVEHGQEKTCKRQEQTSD